MVNKLSYSIAIYSRLYNGSRNLMECGRSSELIKVFKIGICCFYLQLFVGEHMSYLCYLCLLTCSGVQHILRFVFVLFFFVLCTLCCQFLCIVHFLLPLRYSLTFISTKRNAFRSENSVFLLGATCLICVLMLKTTGTARLLYFYKVCNILS